MSAKYVVVRSDFGTESIVVFSELLSHSQFKALGPISAGMIQLGDNDASCYGRSTTLNLDSRPKEDSWLANKQLYSASW